MSPFQLRRFTAFILLGVCPAAATVATIVRADKPEPDRPKHASDSILVKPRPGVNIAALAQLHAPVRAQATRTFPAIGNLQVVKLPPGLTVERALLDGGDELHAGFSVVRIERELNGARPEMIWGTCFERFPNGELVKVKNRSPNLAWYGIPVNHQNVLFRKDVLGPAPYNGGIDSARTTT